MNWIELNLYLFLFIFYKKYILRFKGYVIQRIRILTSFKNKIQWNTKEILKIVFTIKVNYLTIIYLFIYLFV